VNYLKRMGGKDDELKTMRDKLKQLQLKENLYAAIDNLRISARVSSTIDAMVLTQRDREILSWLSLNESESNHNLACKKHQPMTGNWFLESTEFSQWSHSTKATLWLSGKTGSGKTIICSTIIEQIIEMCRSNSNAQCAYFYFVQATRKVDDMLRSLIAQLCTLRNHVLPELQELHDRCRKGQWQPTTSQLVKILLSLLTGPQTFLILDALDECAAAGDARNELLDTIQEIVNDSKSLNLLVTSRKEPDIEKKLTTVCDHSVGLEEKAIQADIALIVQESLKSKDFKKWGESTKTTMEKALVDRAQGMHSPEYYR
jgi:Cdc6-like AAA superfamily ATPase